MTATILLIVHGLLAFLLAGAVTHQAISVWRHETFSAKALSGANFFDSVVGVRGAAYTNAIVVLYVATATLGGVIYPIYILDVKRSLADAGLSAPIGAFEIKEHFAVLGLAMLPSYWYLWKRAEPDRNRLTRQIVTTFLALLVWWSFMIGHILNNLKGLT